MSNSPEQSSWWSKFDCIVCGSKAIGINFGARTCAPCKAFFRRNARRREILAMPCVFGDSSQFSQSQPNEQTKDRRCSQVRYCPSCRLHRCFDMGMREELVRTEEENQRYRQLIHDNRQRRQQSLLPNSTEKSQVVATKSVILQDADWTHLSKLVDAYETHCLQPYIQRRNTIYQECLFLADDLSSNIEHHALTTINNITSLISFLLSISAVQCLPQMDRVYLCQHNIRSLTLLNLHELDQLCFSEPYQTLCETRSLEYIYGASLYVDFIETRNRIKQVLIADPIVTRLWLLILFLSAPLDTHDDLSLPELSGMRKLAILKVQHSYVTLLWKYLSDRHDYRDIVRIISNLNSIYLRIQRISQAISTEIRTRNDLETLHQALNRAVTIDDERT